MGPAGRGLRHPTPDSLGSAQRADVSLQVSVQLTNFSVPARDVSLYGPADVTAIDPRQIVRVQPRHLTTNFESNFFPLIEFDRPDFPWLFTPAKPGAGERLRPWMCLVVVRKRPGVSLGRTETSPLSVLEFTGPVAEDLPDLDESWAWAHAQVVGSATDTVPTLKSAIENAPARTVSRLVCPRRLDPDVAYIACVVPAFEVGRKAGLGFPITEEELTTLEPAWRLDQPTAPFQLPVFYSWEFTTGPEGDFESLVRDLKPRPLPAQVGTRPLDLTRPGFSLPSGGVIPMKGILKPPEPVTAQPQPPPLTLQGKLADILNAPANAVNAPAAQDPIVAPPIYGSTYPPKERVEVSATPQHWVNDLNLDPRDRIAASLGVRIVQEDPGTSDGFRVATGGCHREGEREAPAKAIGRDHTAIHVGAARPADRGRWLTPGHRTQPGESRGVGAGRTGHHSAHRSLAIERVAGARLPIRDVETSGPATRSDQSARVTPAVVQNQTLARPMVKLTQTLPPVDRIVIAGPARIVCRRMVTMKSVSGCCGDASNRFGSAVANDRQRRGGAACPVDYPRDTLDRHKLADNTTCRTSMTIR